MIDGGPVPGAIAFLREAVKRFKVAIYSARSGQPGGIAAMQVALARWATAEAGGNDLKQRWLNEIEWPESKPAAIVYIDDRGWHFTGVWPSMEELARFKTWQGK